MSHLSLNQGELMQVFDSTTDLNSIIKHYENQFQLKGEVICRIKVNELVLTEDDETRLKNTPLAQINCLEVETENPLQLFKDVLMYWTTHLPNLINASDKLSLSLRFKSLDQSALELSQFIDQCHLLVNSLNSISSLCQHRSLPLPPEWSSTELALWKAFNELLDSFNNKNTRIMADIIEYDLAGSLQNWQEVLTKISI